jgi:tetratricopeptide (TPR) repeat protein
VLALLEGQHEPAAERLEQARRAFHDSGERVEEGHALARLGELDTRLGRYPPALDRLREALTLARETGDRAGQAQALTSLGDALLASGHPAEAGGNYYEALELATTIGAADERTRAAAGIAVTRGSSAGS